MPTLRRSPHPPQPIATANLHFCASPHIHGSSSSSAAHPPPPAQSSLVWNGWMEKCPPVRSTAYDDQARACETWGRAGRMSLLQEGLQPQPPLSFLAQTMLPIPVKQHRASHGSASNGSSPDDPRSVCQELMQRPLQDLCSNTLFPSSSRAQEAGLSLFCSSVNPTLDTPDVLGTTVFRLLKQLASPGHIQVSPRTLRQGPGSHHLLAHHLPSLRLDPQPVGLCCLPCPCCLSGS